MPLVKCKKKVLISGAGSFIGKELIRQLYGQYEITVLIRSRSTIELLEKEYPNVQFICAEMKLYGYVMEALPPFDFYIPMAWNGTKREDRDNLEKNRISYQELLTSIKYLIANQKCNRVITIGTQMVYADENGVLRYQKPSPKSAYSRYKLKLYEDTAAVCRERNISMCEIRFWNVYGTGDYNYKMLNTMVEKMARNEKICIRDKNKMYDFLHVRDAAAFIIRVMEAELQIGEVYNVCNGAFDTLGNYISKAKDICGSESEICFGDDIRDEKVRDWSVEINMIREYLKWTPVVSFEEGIREMYEDFCGN